MHKGNLPLYAWIIIAFILISQASWIFRDASKRGENKWLWGLYGLTSAPSSLLIYLLVTRLILKRKRCLNCKKRIDKTQTKCPYCDKEIAK